MTMLCCCPATLGEQGKKCDHVKKYLWYSDPENSGSKRIRHLSHSRHSSRYSMPLESWCMENLQPGAQRLGQGLTSNPLRGHIVQPWVEAAQSLVPRDCSEDRDHVRCTLWRPLPRVWDAKGNHSIEDTKSSNQRLVGSLFFSNANSRTDEL